MHRVLAYAVRKKRLDKNPLSKGNLPEGWSPPEKPEEAVDPRSVGSPELIATMLTYASYVGRRQGPRFVAFYGCMFYAMMRPAEVTSLTEDGCHLPETGWGRLVFSDSSPAAGREFTDDGRVHEERGLKGRDRQTRTRTRAARARRATRSVPIPPELVTLLRDHIKQFGSSPDGRLFRSESGNLIQPSTYWRLWQKVRALALTPAQRATPLLRRPYDLRHSGVTWRLNSRVPATEVAAWAGHSVEVLMRVYARCVVGLEEVWITLMEASLRSPGSAPVTGPAASGRAGENSPGGTTSRTAKKTVMRKGKARSETHLPVCKDTAARDSHHAPNQNRPKPPQARSASCLWGNGWTMPGRCWRRCHETTWRRGRAAISPPPPARETTVVPHPCWSQLFWGLRSGAVCAGSNPAGGAHHYPAT